MLADRYGEQLIKETRALDKYLGSGEEFEELSKEIVKQDNQGSIVELLRKLVKLERKEDAKKIEEKKSLINEVLYLYLGSKQIENVIFEYKTTSNLSLDDLMTQLGELVGLDSVKEQVCYLIHFNRIQQQRVKMGLKRTNKTLHMAFLGNPGTAKTTVARIVGRMYKAIGLLSKGQFIEASRTDLIAEYQGQTAIKVKKLIERAKGGVLFIDEAYSITENKQSDSYGRECLTELTKALEDYRDDLVVIVAGYTDLMEQFFTSNPGLKSRFNTFITFNDYTLEELVDIFSFTCKKNDYVIEEGAMDYVRTAIQFELQKQVSHFSNGRFIRNLFDDITMNQANRLAKKQEEMQKEDLMLLKKEDIQIPINDKLVDMEVSEISKEGYVT